MLTATMDGSVDRKSQLRQKTAKPLMWVGIVSIVMFLADLQVQQLWNMVMAIG